MSTEFEASVSARLAAIEAQLVELKSKPATLPTASPPVTVDPALNGPYDNPTVKYPNNQNWPDQSLQGKPMSECSVAFLEKFASFKDWCAGQDEAKGKLTSSGKPASFYGKMDAARARAWAKKIANGGVTPKSENDDDSIPF